MTDQQLEYEIKDWQEGKRFKTMNNISDQLPTLTAEEVEQIEKEAADFFVASENQLSLFTAGAVWASRRAKKEREKKPSDLNTYAPEVWRNADLTDEQRMDFFKESMHTAGGVLFSAFHAMKLKTHIVTQIECGGESFTLHFSKNLKTE